MKKILEKISHIIMGWYYMFIGKNHELLQDRMKICNTCDKKIQITKNTYMCTICGCFLHMKTRVKDEECPLGKWKRI